MDRRLFCMELLGSGLVMGGFVADTEAAPLPSVQKLQWHKVLKVAHRLAIQTDKPMLIVFGASWCTWCRKMEGETLSDERSIALIQRDFIPVHQDRDTDSRVAEILEVEKLPCIVVLSPEADLLAKAEGYADFKRFSKILQSALAKQAEIRRAAN